MISRFASCSSRSISADERNAIGCRSRLEARRARKMDANAKALAIAEELMRGDHKVSRKKAVELAVEQCPGAVKNDVLSVLREVIGKIEKGNNL